MKRLILAFGLLTFLILRVVSPSVASPIYWAETFKDVNKNLLLQGSLKSVQHTSDGGLIVLDSCNGYNVKIIKLDSNGDTEWAKAITNLNTWAQSIKQTPEGGFIVAGSARGTDNARDVWIMKLDANGTIEWQKFFTADEYKDCAAYSVGLTNDGGYIIAGSIRKTGNGSLLLIKLSATGNLEWTHKYDKELRGHYSSDPTDERGYSVQQTSDGGYVVAGHTESFGAGSVWRNHFLVLKVDSTGGLEWTHEFGGYSSEDEAYSITETNDGDFIIVGNNHRNAWILKLNNNGEIIWSKILSSGRGYYPKAVRIINDGGFIVGGSYVAQNWISSGWLARFSSEGELLWQKLYGSETAHQSFYDIAVVYDGIIAVGNTGSFGSWVLKVDSDGELLNCDLVYDFNASVNIYEGPGLYDDSMFKTFVRHSNLLFTDNVTRHLTSIALKTVKSCFYEPVNEPPQIDSFTADPIFGQAPLAVSFTCQAHDPDGGTIPSIQWFLGDFEYPEYTFHGDFNLTHTYDTPGTYTVYCRVWDDEDDNATSSSITITVSAPTPTWQDITEDINVTTSRTLYDRINRCFFVYLTLTNASGSDLSGPIRMILDSSTIPLLDDSSKPGLDPDGYTEDGKPYFILVPDNESWSDGESLNQIRLDFKLMRKRLNFELKFEQYK